MIPVPTTALAALARTFGANVADLAQYGGGREDSDGIIYAYPTDAGRRLLKIMAFPAEQQRIGMFYLAERLRFMRYLGENGAAIAYPLVSPQGALYETTATASHLWVGYSMAIAPGQIVPAEKWDPKFFQTWGQTIGRLHRLASKYPDWPAAVDPINGEAVLTWREEWQGFCAQSPDAEIEARWRDLGRYLETLPVARAVFGFTHNDPHIWNLLYDGARITVLDFDVANYHWFINDIAIACQSILFTQTGGMERPVQDRPRLQKFFRVFMAGYEQEHHLPAEWLGRLDHFIAYRRLLLFTVMQGWLRSQPARLAAWRQMILSTPEVVGAL